MAGRWTVGVFCALASATLACGGRSETVWGRWSVTASPGPGYEGTPNTCVVRIEDMDRKSISVSLLRDVDADKEWLSMSLKSGARADEWLVRTLEATEAYGLNSKTWRGDMCTGPVEIHADQDAVDGTVQATCINPKNLDEIVLDVHFRGCPEM